MNKAMTVLVLMALGCNVLKADVPPDYSTLTRSQLKGELAALRMQTASLLAMIDRLDAAVPVGVPPSPERGTNGGWPHAPAITILGVPAR